MALWSNATKYSTRFWWVQSNRIMLLIQFRRGGEWLLPPIRWDQAWFHRHEAMKRYNFGSPYIDISQYYLWKANPQKDRDYVSSFGSDGQNLCPWQSLCRLWLIIGTKDIIAVIVGYKDRRGACELYNGSYSQDSRESSTSPSRQATWLQQKGDNKLNWESNHKPN